MGGKFAGLETGAKPVIARSVVIEKAVPKNVEGFSNAPAQSFTDPHAQFFPGLFPDVPNAAAVAVMIKTGGPACVHNPVQHLVFGEAALPQNGFQVKLQVRGPGQGG